jgi:hypothetical protein
METASFYIIQKVGAILSGTISHVTIITPKMNPCLNENGDDINHQIKLRKALPKT